jgi:hypothetical protein
MPERELRMGVVGVGKARDVEGARVGANPLKLWAEVGNPGVTHADAQAVGDRWESAASI